MKGHIFLDSDITRTLQDGVDKTLKTMPKTPAPEGFTWQAIVKQVADTDNKYTYILDWVAKPNGN